MHRIIAASVSPMASPPSPPPLWDSLVAMTTHMRKNVATASRPRTTPRFAPRPVLSSPSVAPILSLATGNSPESMTFRRTAAATAPASWATTNNPVCGHDCLPMAARATETAGLI